MLEFITSTLTEGLAVLDKELRYVLVNDAAERLIGVTREHLLGRRPEEVLPPAVLEQAMRHMRAALATGQAVTYDTHVPWVDRWFESRLYPSSDGRLLVLFVDVTDRHLVAEQLRRREEMQALLVSLHEQTRHLQDPDEVMWTCVRGLGTYLRVAHCMFGEVDATGQLVVVTRPYVDNVPSVAGQHRLDDFGLALASELHAGRSLVVDDVWSDVLTADARTRASFEALGVRAFIAMPLLKNDRLVATLSVLEPSPRQWHDDERALLERLAEQTWSAVTNARAEAALRASRDVLALAMRSGRMGAWSRDLGTGDVWWSRELEEIFALPPGGFAGTNAGFLAFVHPDDRPGVEAAVSEAIRSGDDYAVEFRFKAADGWRWMDGRGRAVYAEDGSPAWLYGIGIDITDRRLADEALAAAQEAAAADAARLHLAMAAAALGDWSWDIGSDLVTVSPRGAEIFGVPPGQPHTWTQLHDRLHPDDRARTRTGAEHAVQTRSDYAAEYRLVHQGRDRWVSARGRLRLDSSGAPIGMQGIVQDVSHDRLLVHLDDAIRSLTSAADIGSTAARLVGQYLGADRCVYVTMGPGGLLTAAGSYAHAADGIVSADPHHHLEDIWRGPWRNNDALVWSDASAAPMFAIGGVGADAAVAEGAVVAAPILKAGRLVAGLAVHTSAPRLWHPHEVALVQQVASRCWESMQRARAEAERTALLARERLARLEAEQQNRRLAQLSDAAEAASRAKDEFMAMLGHELRNPLAPILTALQLLRLRGDVGSEHERVVIERQVRHLTRLVDDLLDVSRIASGKVELKLVPVETAEIVARASEMASPLLEERAHTLTVDVPRSGLPMIVDPARLSQVIANLLTNAARYTPPGGAISVTGALDGEDIHVAVRDSGIGIAAEVLPTVFDLFVQGRQASDRAEGGLGLGLAIVRNLVERHGGRVRAESDGLGRGSTFGVWVPCAPMRADQAPLPAQPAGTAAVAPSRRSRVLIVDDNEDAADMLASVLSMRGHETRVAHDGVEALRMCEDFTPHAAFLDLGLPVMDGYELAGRLRDQPGLAEIRLIAVTGYGQESDRRRTAAAGFHHHLVKPVDIATIEALLT